jgi:hypothetical protein
MSSREERNTDGGFFGKTIHVFRGRKEQVWRILWEDYSCLHGKKGTGMEDSLGRLFMSSREERNTYGGFFWKTVHVFTGRKEQVWRILWEEYSCLHGKKGTSMEDSLGRLFMSTREERNTYGGFFWKTVHVFTGRKEHVWRILLEDYSCLHGKKGTSMEDSFGRPFMYSREERNKYGGFFWKTIHVFKGRKEHVWRILLEDYSCLQGKKGTRMEDSLG